MQMSISNELHEPLDLVGGRGLVSAVLLSLNLSTHNPLTRPTTIFALSSKNKLAIIKAALAI